MATLRNRVSPNEIIVSLYALLFKRNGITQQQKLLGLAEHFALARIGGRDQGIAPTGATLRNRVSPNEIIVSLYALLFKRNGITQQQKLLGLAEHFALARIGGRDQEIAPTPTRCALRTNLC